ncbi:hypothetical protein PRIPAC_84955 [Pristionchus pacificus]|uniref:Trypsin n=1 Tax=Pristionchus pacificus TaxID=54126 RepID=A0A2A6BVB0_PRIPA|nr:hypothetical protein PRIPAC_84955 [Pristionchus pacificus]|eukprot:PDM69766.1 Trypsin [Pristionchus pacificus]
MFGLQILVGASVLIAAIDGAAETEDFLFGDECGRTPIPPSLLSVSPHTSTAIVGGTPATPYSWPWQAVVCKNEWWGLFCSFQCSGIVIGKQWVLTAADCLDANTQNWSVRTGVFDESQKEGSEQKPKIRKVHIHKDFDRKTKRNNIALIQLEKDLILDTFTQPVCLPATGKEITSNSTGWITGWGYQKRLGSIQKALQQAEIVFDEPETCEHTWGREIYDSELCAGEIGTLPCTSDAGDPLVVRSPSSGRWFAHGSVSMTDEKCKLPGIFSKLSHYCKWIASTTGHAVRCMDWK